jgi:transcriptional regulator with XRE-family HTH domain
MRRLATRAGLSVAYLSDVERATRNVSCDFLVRVAYYPGESAESLFSE